MGLLATAKKKAEEHIVSAAASGTGILILAVWNAIPQKKWDDLLSAVAPKTLWALLGLSLVAICALSAYAYDLRRRLKPGLKYQYGVLWDNEHTPLCPACKVPLTHFKPSKNDTTIFRCLKCAEHIRPKDLDGKTVSAGEAIRTVSGIK